MRLIPPDRLEEGEEEPEILSRIRRVNASDNLKPSSGQRWARLSHLYDDIYDHGCQRPCNRRVASRLARDISERKEGGGAT